MLSVIRIVDFIITVTDTVVGVVIGFIKVGGRNNPVESELDIALLGAPRQMGEDDTFHSWGFNKPGGDVIIGKERQLFVWWTCPSSSKGFHRRHKGHTGSPTNLGH